MTKKFLFLFVMFAIIALAGIIRAYTVGSKASFPVASGLEFSIDHHLRFPAPTGQFRASDELQEFLQFLASAPQEATPATAIVSALPELNDQSAASATGGLLGVWRYRSFMQVGDSRNGVVESLDTGNTYSISEGSVCEDVRFTGLGSTSCVASIEGASEVLSLAFWKGEELPDDAVETTPSREFLAYREETLPVFIDAYMRFIPKGAGADYVKTPVSAEEMQTAAADFFATVRPTIEAGGRGPEFRGALEKSATPDPSRSDETLEEWIEIHRAVQMNLKDVSN